MSHVRAFSSTDKCILILFCAWGGREWKAARKIEFSIHLLGLPFFGKFSWFWSHPTQYTERKRDLHSPKKEMRSFLVVSSYLSLLKGPSSNANTHTYIHNNGWKKKGSLKSWWGRRVSERWTSGGEKEVFTYNTIYTRHPKKCWLKATINKSTMPWKKEEERESFFYVFFKVERTIGLILRNSITIRNAMHCGIPPFSRYLVVCKAGKKDRWLP